MKKVKLISILTISIFAFSAFAPSILATFGTADDVVASPETRVPSDKACIQVITNATSPSGECKVFSTPCEVPEGWIVVSDCSSSSNLTVLYQNTASSIEDFLVQLRKDKEDFKNNKLKEEVENDNSLKEKTAAKRKATAAKAEEARKAKEEKRKAVLTRLLDIQIKQLGNIKERVSKMPNITADLKIKLNTASDAAVAILAAKKTEVTAATTPEELKKIARDIKDLFKAKREIVKQIVDAILASKAEKTIDAAEGRLADITEKIAELKAAGQDVTELEALLAIAQAKIAAANTKAGKKDLKGAINDLKQAYNKMKSILEEIEDEPTVSSSPLASPSVTPSSSPSI